MPRTNRRDFLRTGVAAGAFLGLPAATYAAGTSRVDPPSEKIRIGSIGVGRQGTGNLKKLMPHVVAVCDVDKKHLATAAAAVEKEHRPPQTFGDYRKLLEMKELDAVCITTPDHWHALQTIEACVAGKDVFIEKPLSLTIDEGKAMVAAARKYNRVVQTGSMQRSGKEFRTACELVRNGAVGTVKTVKVGLPKPNFSGPAVKDGTPPENLDYDLWLGPAPKKPYNEKHVHYLFRFFWDYSGGQQTNFGAHHLDIAQWGLGMDESGPVSAEGKAKYHPQGWYETPDWTDITYKYANGVVMHCGQDYKQGTLFEGEKGVLYVTRGKLEAAPEILKHPITDKFPVGPDHHKNWLDCIKTRQKPVADVAIGHRSATVCHLGNVAVRTGKLVKWDPTKEQFVDAEFAPWLSREYRGPWKLPA